MTVVIIGDVGGCLEQLVRAVAELPRRAGPDPVVVQVGDLVDRGPDSAGVLAFVREQPAERWIQLIGNHESQYLGGEPFWPHPLAGDDAALLRDWWLRDRLQVAAAVRTGDGEELLVTHAGLSVAAWRELDGPVTAATAAGLLNTRPEPLLWDDRGPLWAEAGSDVYPSWLEPGRPMPFGQVHGHSTIADFARREWRCGERIRLRSTADWAARHTFTRAGGARFIGVDPRHGRTGAAAWAPLVLPGAVLLS